MPERKGTPLIHVMHCREIARLLDSDAVSHLSWVDRVQVRVHLWVCWHCRLLKRQIAWIRAMAKNRLRSAASLEANPNFELKLMERLRSR